VFKCLRLSCQQLFQNGDNLKKHTKDFHKEEEKYQCQKCSKCFSSLSQLQVHKKSRHETDDLGVIKCTKTRCQTTVSYGAHLKKHMENPFEDRNATRSTLKITEIAKNSVLECQFCSKVFKSRVKMRRHSMRHETDTPCVIKCIYKGCKQTFTSATVLKMHAAKHWEMAD
jgi:Zinc finger, C2H2 type